MICLLTAIKERQVFILMVVKLPLWACVSVEVVPIMAYALITILIRRRLNALTPAVSLNYK